jgi:predicted butyrate kinase (DUF1464 family)
MKTLFKTIVILLSIGCFFSASAVNGTAVMQSALVPGMGQMANGQKYVGMGFMFAEIISIHLAFNEMSKASAYQRETNAFNTQFTYSKSYDESMDILEKWNNSYDNAVSSKKMALLWTAAAGGIWALNVLETFIFVPKSDDEVSLKKTTPLFALEVQDGGLGLKLNKNF